MAGREWIGAVFALLIVLMLVIGAVRPLKTPWVQEDARAVDMTPSKHKGKAGLVLMLIVLAIYAVFADFSVMREGQVGPGRRGQVACDTVPGTGRLD